MEFKIAVIGDHMYGDRTVLTDGIPDEVQDVMSNTPSNTPSKGYYDEELNSLIKGKGQDKKLPNPIVITQRNGQQVLTFNSYKQLAEEYLLLLGTAHECVVEEDKNKNLIYQGPSPDEITLVDAAKNMGYVYRRSDNQFIYLQIMGHEERFELLSVHPFSSERKRMSVIIRHNGLIKMYVKGVILLIIQADSIVKARTAPNQPYMGVLDSYLNTFSVKGLRTLLVGMKVLSQGEYDAFRDAEAKLPEEGRSKQRE